MVDQYTSIQVNGEYYEPIAGGDTTQPSGWDNVGSFIAQIDALTGDTLEIGFYAGLSSEELSNR